MPRRVCLCFFEDAQATELYTLSLHDALPILGPPASPAWSSCMPSSRPPTLLDRKSTRLNSSHANISYAVFCLKKKISAAVKRSSDVANSNGAAQQPGEHSRGKRSVCIAKDAS